MITVVGGPGSVGTAPVRRLLACQSTPSAAREEDPTEPGTDRPSLGTDTEEVALLAGVSIDYYIKLERGNLSGVSDSVLESIATAGPSPGRR